MLDLCWTSEILTGKAENASGHDSEAPVGEASLGMDWCYH